MMYAVTPAPLETLAYLPSSGKLRWSMRSRPHTAVGTSGVDDACGVTDSDGADTALVPTEFVAVTVNV
jgi:hypothetical protein